jgi:hypothetical protein
VDRALANLLAVHAKSQGRILFARAVNHRAEVEALAKSDAGRRRERIDRHFPETGRWADWHDVDVNLSGCRLARLGHGVAKVRLSVGQHDDPMRAMQALPGVATGDDFQSQFSVRGSAFREVGIVIDGTATPLLLHTIRNTNDTGSIAMINTDMLG